jgi:monofunctional chorismate mutase
MDDLKQLRKKIDSVDDQLLHLFAERVKICQNIGATKKAQNLPIQDKTREEEVYRRTREKAAKLRLNPIQVEAVYREIVNMCSSVQE